MEKVIFFVPEDRPNTGVSLKDRAPVPAAPGKTPSTSRASSSVRRDREMRQLIHDLAVLAANRRQQLS